MWKNYLNKFIYYQSTLKIILATLSKKTSTKGQEANPELKPWFNLFSEKCVFAFL